ncbi:MAG TPA: helicase, partial [Opitutales bacterium]|nr:helicase [Opitutales bacterium]
MAAFPVHPRYSRMLIAANTMGCVRALCRIAALAQLGSPLVRGHSKSAKPAQSDWLDGDFLSDFFRELHGWNLARQSQDMAMFCDTHGLDFRVLQQAERLTKDFERIAVFQGLSLDERDNIPQHWAQCILMGFKDRLAKRLDTGTLRCALIHNRRAELRRTSVVQDAPLFVAADLEEVEIR